MFPKINSLPCAERQFAIGNGDAEIHRRQCCADMSWHIVVTFARVTKEGIAVGNEPGEKPFEITANFRVGIFLDQKRGGGVLKMERGETCVEVFLRDVRGNLVGKFVKPASSRFDNDFVDRLPHVQRTLIQRFACDNGWPGLFICAN